MARPPWNKAAGCRDGLTETVSPINNRAFVMVTIGCLMLCQRKLEYRFERTQSKQYISRGSGVPRAVAQPFVVQGGGAIPPE